VITHFARYACEDFDVMQLRVPELPTHSALPGDYRTKEEIFKQVERERRKAEALGICMSRIPCLGQTILFARQRFKL
jgi:hypothetical protein